MSYLGEEIPKLGFGLMRLPQLEDGKGADIEQVKKMVDAFMAAGCNYFDTARAYGTSEADTKIALVDRYPRDSYYLATKNAAWLGAKNAEEAKAMFDTSLANLGVDYIDFYLIHNVGGPRAQVFEDYGMWDYVKELKAAGKVKHIGFSMHDTAEALEEICKAHPEAEFVQLQINYADWENGGVQARKCFEVAEKYNLPVIIMEPVHGGTLANPPQEVVDILKEGNPDISCVDWALRFCWSLPNVITVLSGMSTLEQMEQNLASFKAFEPLSEEDRKVLDRAQAKLAELTAVPCTACRYCMKACPVGMPIDEIMECLNRNALYGIGDAKNNYGFTVMGRTKASECLQCGVCVDACPQKIDVIEELKTAADLFE